MSREYTLLFNTITDLIERLEALKDDLMNAQRKAEEMYMERTD